MPQPFYWRNARDSLVTTVAVQLFQITASHEGEDFDVAKSAIDSEYAQIRGHESERHGGKIQTAKDVYREAGWLDLSPDNNGKHIIRITPAGRQALLLLGKVPDFLAAVPRFVIDLLSRFQLNNPARPDSRDPEYDAHLRESNVFPYWTLFRVMRACENSIESDELKRFVFQIKRSEDVPGVIEQIREYRRDKASGSSEDDLNRKYPAPLQGAVAEPKYLMGRLGTQVGDEPPVVRKEGLDRWVLEDSYLPFIDKVLEDEPTFRDYLDERSWMGTFGQPVDLLEDEDESLKTSENDLALDDNDPIWLKAKGLLDAGSLTLILTGPPGTSKTWYARRLAHKIAGVSRHVRQIQFHPSFSYDDFIEGYVPVSPKSGGSNGALFEVVPKVFIRLCERAQDISSQMFVLVIDEINRGDISRIFGELLTYLESDYRGRPFSLAYSGARTTIPRNVVLIGTMNPYDRSITELDDALERRFDRIALNPDVNILRRLLANANAADVLIQRIVHFFEQANAIAPHGLGHAFFKGVANEDDLIRLWNHNLKFVFDKMFRFDTDKYEELRTAFKAMLPDASVLS